MTVSAFVRQRVFGEAGNKPAPSRRDYRPVADRQALAQALALLGQSRIANNLNQLAYHAHLGTLPVDGGTAARIDEAYATTIHKAQGATVDRTFLLASGRMDGHMTYVGLTRHRHEARLYGDGMEVERLTRGTPAVEPHDRRRERQPQPPRYR